MRLPRFRLRSVMISIAFLALILTVFVQAILLQRAVVLEQQMRADAERQRAMAEAQAQRVQIELERSRQQVQER
jgi:NhaP-type Na+/H+ or K+/H+ antiporter